MEFKMHMGQQQNGSLLPITHMKNTRLFSCKQEEQEEITSIGLSL